MSNISASDQAVLSEFESKHGPVLSAVEKAKKFNLGDYLILRVKDFAGNFKIKSNSYGAPVKFVVVHINRHGIPFIKKVSKQGNPVGKMYSCIGSLEGDDYCYPWQDFEFILDPDFADSILLQDSYDPSTQHKARQEIWKAVTEHNKKHKIQTRSIAKIVNFLQTVNVGDTLWSSTRTYFVVQDKKLVPRGEVYKSVKNAQTHRIKGPFILVLTIVDKKGKVKNITADFFEHKALYSQRPRSYAELKI